ncbi:MAG: HD domain-containing protein [Thermoplasmatota archaeon]
MKYKTIQDTVHGSVKFTGPFLKLLECPEVQRLHNIKQLGLTKLVFPGANHTRLEHSIGTYRVAGKMADNLDLSEKEKNTVMSAALLHDIGHAPFSHTLENLLNNETDKDHMDITKDFITGERAIDSGREVPKIPVILEEHGISPEEVAELIKGKDDRVSLDEFNVHEGQKYFGGERYLYQIIHGPVDVDQLDYLLRDSHYTGAAHGIIDIERILQTIEIYNGDLVISKGGVPAVEGVLVARGLMFSSVYLHKTARIAELMLAKAVKGLDEDLEKLYWMTDYQLLSFLEGKVGFQKEIVERLRYRRLYKRCFSLDWGEMESTETDLEQFNTIEGITSLEKKIARRAGIPENMVLVDIPHDELKLSEPRLTKTNVKVLDDGKLNELSKYSPLARALQRRTTQTWGLMVSCPIGYKNKVADATKKILD